MKTCTTCKIEKLYTEFHKNKSKKDGYNFQCKLCRKQYALENSEHIKQYINKYNIDNPDYKKNWYQLNKITISENGKQYYKLNAPVIKKRVNKYYHLNVEIISPKYKKYRQTEQGKLVHTTSTHKRRALLKFNTPIGKHFTVDDIKIKLKLQHGKCIYCQTSIKNEYDIDHIIPVVKGGSNEANNIQLLCKNCNRGKDGKGIKDAIEYAKKHGKLC